MSMDKRAKILKKLDRFEEGQLNVITGTKKTPFLYNGREIASLAGSLLHFCFIHHYLRPYLTPFFRLLDSYTLTIKVH